MTAKSGFNCLRVLLGAILLSSGLLKLMSPASATSGFYAQVELLPRSLAGIALWTISLTEMILGWTLILKFGGPGYRLPLLACIGLGGSFVTSSAIRLVSLLDADCGCLGALSKSLPPSTSLFVGGIIVLLAFILLWAENLMHATRDATASFSLGCFLSACFLYVGNSIPISPARIKEVQINSQWPGFKTISVFGVTPAQYLERTGSLSGPVIVTDSRAFHLDVSIVQDDTKIQAGYVMLYTIPYKLDRLGFIKILAYYSGDYTLTHVVMEDMSVGANRRHDWIERLKKLSTQICESSPHPYVILEHSNLIEIHPLARQIVQSLNTAGLILMLEVEGQSR